MTASIVGLGDLTLDVLLIGVAEMPRWGQEAEFLRTERRLGGNLGNFALGAAALGLRASCFGPIGTDAEGRWLVERLRDIGASADCVWAVPDMVTSQTFAVVRPDGERLFLTQPGALVRLEQMIAERPLPPADVVFLTGWCQPPRISARLLVDCLTRWRSEGRQLVFDLSWADSSWKRRDDVLMVLSRTDWALLDEEELVALTGKTDVETGMAVLRGEISQSPKTPVGIVVKRGAAGAAIVWRSDISFVRAPTVRTRDTVGAGDLFNAGLLHALYTMRQVPLLAVQFATTFASLSLQRERWNLPSEADVLTKIEREESP